MPRILAAAALLALTPRFGLAPDPAQAADLANLSAIQRRLLSGFATVELNPPPARGRAAAQQAMLSPAPTSANGCKPAATGNARVNQNCLNMSSNVSDSDYLQGRGQAQNEPAIAQDPNNANHVVAAYNDYRRGDSACGISYSSDGGATWTDSAAPIGFTYGEPTFGAYRQYWQAGGNNSVAWDTRGNAYVACLLFNRGPGITSNPDESSGVYVLRSTASFGASFNFPARPAYEVNGVANPLGADQEDKPYMTVDNHVKSAFRDRIYVTWTEFLPDGATYIWEVNSNDYGETFSSRVLVSSDSALCPNTQGAGTSYGRCNENQFSQPFTGPDGSLYVVFANYNSSTTGAADNRSQILLVKSSNGGKTFSAPVLVGDYYDLPDCASYQMANGSGLDPGSACIPEKGSSANSYFRAANYPSGAVNPQKPKQVVVAFGSYINPHSKENGCTPDGFSTYLWPLYTGVKKAGACNNDIMLSVSSDGGVTFTGAGTDPRKLSTINSAPRQATTDQFWQWIAFTSSGKLAVSYYDREYGGDETTGFSDISLSGSSDLVHFAAQRVTSSSMPPPTGFEGTFLGDYGGLTALGKEALPAWADTRTRDLFLCPGTGTPGVPPTLCTAAAPNAAFANQQNVYTSAVAVPVPGK
ncbi:MAG: sialidase family protein [Candidatus Binataceae bacterium]